MDYLLRFDLSTRNEDHGLNWLGYFAGLGTLLWLVALQLILELIASDLVCAWDQDHATLGPEFIDLGCWVSYGHTMQEFFYSWNLVI